VLGAIESWMVRRMLVRATTKNYNQVVAEVVTAIQNGNRDSSGDFVEAYLAGQTSASRYWPDDEEVLGELRDLLAYRRLGRGRLRMVLEAVEDHLRGWVGGKEALGGERVARGKLAIEHIMPRKWHAHWPLPEGVPEDHGRDQLVHTFGNLTLLTGKLNSKVSNGPWLGLGCKREALEGNDVLFLNRELVKENPATWTDAAIRARTDALARIIVSIWPVPAGHKSGYSQEKVRPRHKVDLLDLINANALHPGMHLYPRRKKLSHRVATLLTDGRIDIDGKVFDTPSAAAVSLTGKPTNGWSFFLVDPSSRRSLRDVWRDYVDKLAVDVDDDEAEADGDDEEN
jgi:hypothetical protein